VSLSTRTFSMHRPPLPRVLAPGLQ
jgi:hypothetical protein